MGKLFFSFLAKQSVKRKNKNNPEKNEFMPQILTLQATEGREQNIDAFWDTK